MGVGELYIYQLVVEHKNDRLMKFITVRAETRSPEMLLFNRTYCQRPAESL